MRPSPETARPARPRTRCTAAPPSLPPEGIDLYAVLGEMEDRLIREALDRTGGNRNQAARYLGLNRTTLVEKLRKLAKR